MKKFLVGFGLQATVLVAAVAATNPFAKPGLPMCLWNQPEPINLPALLETASGENVTTAERWEKVRRPEIVKLFEDCAYGRRPVGRPEGLSFADEAPEKTMMDGKAVRKQVAISFKAPKGEGVIHVLAFLPVSKESVPSFVLICNRPKAKNLDPERVTRTEFWPAEELVARGYAAVAFHYEDIAPDRYDGFTSGIYPLYQDPAARTETDWGALSAWAWGASRVMDWIETEPRLDAKAVAVIGHSRGGKTSLWAGATDTRFALTCVNDSGCGGARLNHLLLSNAETIGLLRGAQPHWMCAAWGKWGGRELDAPFDQHQLMALVAPRLLAIGSASQDNGAGPYGEWLSAKLASPAWELYGRKGLVIAAFPKENEACQDGRLSYHLRAGEHDLKLSDWNRYMDFFDSKRVGR